MVAKGPVFGVVSLVTAPGMLRGGVGAVGPGQTRYISSNGTSSWTKYDRGERLPNTPMCTSAVPSALHTV